MLQVNVLSFQQQCSYPSAAYHGKRRQIALQCQRTVLHDSRYGAKRCFGHITTQQAKELSAEFCSFSTASFGMKPPHRANLLEHGQG